jgi:hypothetical protein
MGTGHFDSGPVFTALPFYSTSSDRLINATFVFTVALTSGAADGDVT